MRYWWLLLIIMPIGIIYSVLLHRWDTRYDIRIKIGTTDYTLEQMKNGDASGGFGTSTTDILDTIKQFQDEGYRVSFKRTYFIGGTGKYNIIAEK